MNTGDHTDSNNHVLVSVIIPAYNTGEYVHRAIESSLRQTHSNVEVIVIDDGSKDNTLEVARSYADRDSRVRVFHKENGGVSSARNMGIHEAHGEYIVFLDSDDWLEDCAVEVLLDAQIKYPDKLIKAERWYNNLFDSRREHFLRYARNTGAGSKQFTLEEALARMDSLRMRSLFAKIFRADIIREDNIMFSEKLNQGEDIFFVFEYISRTDGVACVDKMVWNRLARPGSLSRVSMASPERRINSEDYLQRMIDYPTNTDTIRELMKVRYVRANLSELNQSLNEGVETKKLLKTRDNARKYMHEFFRSGNMSLSMKIYYCLEIFTPVFFARLVSKSFFLYRKIKGKIKRKIKSEVIEIW